MLFKCCIQICQQIWKTQQWPQDWKRSVFILIPKKGNTKECSNYYTIALIPYTSKAMLKILLAKLQQYVNQELPNVQAGFRKGNSVQFSSVQSLSRVRLFATPWTAACHAPPSMGFSRQEYQSGSPLPPPLLACEMSAIVW